MNRLDAVILQLRLWRARHAGRTAKRCLEAVRWACSQEGLRLPWRPWPMNTALGCLSVLKRDPERYGWVRAQRDANGDLPSPCLVFFDNCGRLRDGRTAGHIAVYKSGEHLANERYPFSDWWESRVAGAFVPKP